MNKLSTLLVAIVAVLVAAPVGTTPALADTPSATPSLGELNQQLNDAQSKLDSLNDQVERSQAKLDELNRKLSDDQRREADVSRRLAQLARLEYEQPAVTLSTVLEARSLDQLLSNLAQARLLAHKQQLLLAQARDLRRQDEQARDQMKTQVSAVKASRDQAAQVADKVLAMRNMVQDQAMQTRAAALASQARATQAPAPAAATAPAAPSGSWPNHFAFGYCTWYVANRRYVPWYGNAIQWYSNAAAYGYPEGGSPRVGSIMVTAESGYGHVAYVESVGSDGSWTVSEMNYTAWDVVDQRTIRPGQVPLIGFIYGN